MKNQNDGPAAKLIDFGFSVKLPLCEGIDAMFGIDESDPRSAVRFLRTCYDVRRPAFVLLDSFASWPNALSEAK